jgi:cell wall-associated NlpC family hydrolase
MSAATWYFEDQSKVDLLRAEAKSWLGTRFVPFSRAKGGGIDCVGFVEEVLAAAGLERLNFQRTDADYSRHTHNTRILDYMRGTNDDPQSKVIAARLADIPVKDHEFTEPPMPGDILVLKDGSDRTGLGIWHMPVMMTNRKFMQSAPRLGVCEGNIKDSTYRTHLEAHFRARATPLVRENLSTKNSQLETAPK